MSTYVPLHLCSLQAIVVSQFLLSLRKAADADFTIHLDLGTSSGRSPHSRLKFASFVGPMGGSLDIGLDEELDNAANGAGDRNEESQGP